MSLIEKKRKIVVFFQAQPPKHAQLCSDILKEKKMEITDNLYHVPQDLKPFVKAIWFVSANGQAGEMSPMQCCLPNGLAELIINLTPQYRHGGELQGNWMTFPNDYVVGVMSEPVYWNMEAGAVIMGVSLRPEAFMRLFNLSIGDIADTIAETKAFFGALLGDLITQLREAPDHETRQQILVQDFRRREAVQQSRQAYFFHALEHIHASAEVPSVEDICEQVSVGKRQLQRAFQDNLGISLKTYGRIIRFTKVYDFIYKNPQRKLTEIAHHFGYADQSHFIREFREFTRESPSSFISEYELQARMPVALN